MRFVARALVLIACLQASPTLASGVSIVFFEYDSTRLVDPGGAILDNVEEQVRVLQVPRLIIGAHADRAGSSSYNLQLSRRRAEAVRDELIRRGLSGVTIDIEVFGENRPLVETADGVAEVQNRRADIMIVCIGNRDRALEYMRC
jgi:outer membrane protein OmpA-like peptidoglycan-associated protein